MRESAISSVAGGDDNIEWQVNTPIKLYNNLTDYCYNTVYDECNYYTDCGKTYHNAYTYNCFYSGYENGWCSRKDFSYC